MTSINDLTNLAQLNKVHEGFMLLHLYLDCKRELAHPKITAAQAEWWTQRSIEVLSQLPAWALVLINEDIL